MGRKAKITGVGQVMVATSDLPLVEDTQIDAKPAVTVDIKLQGKNFDFDDVVWAKLQGFPHWPAKIVAPRVMKVNKRKSKHPGQNLKFVEFFGDHSYSQIELRNIENFAENKDKFVSSKAIKNHKFVASLEEAEEFISSRNNPTPAATIIPATIKQEPIGSHTPTPVPSPVPSVNSKRKQNVKVDKVKSKKIKTEEPTKKKSVVNPDAAIQRLIKTAAAARKLKQVSFEETIQNINPGGPSSFTNVAIQQGTVKTSRLNTKDAHQKVYGFIGMGSLGKILAMRLIKRNLKVVLWNRDLKKCSDLTSGVTRCTCPGDVVQLADITFCCLTNGESVMDVFHSTNGILQAMHETTGYIEMTGLDLKSNEDLADATRSKGARYLELQAHGTLQEAESGNLILMGAGDMSLFEDAQLAIKAMSDNIVFLGERLGSAVKVNLLMQGMRGGILCLLGELLSLAKVDENSDLPEKFISMLKATSWGGLFFSEKWEIFNRNDASRKSGTSKTPVVVQQKTNNISKDLQSLLTWGNQLNGNLPLIALLTQIVMRAKRLGHTHGDESAVFYSSLFADEVI